MKKVLKGFVALALTLLMFAAPTTAQAATWLSITDNSVGSYFEKEFVYNPADPLIINPGQTAGLPNNVTNGGFLIRAGQNFTLSVMFSNMAESNVKLYNQTTGQFVATQYNSLSNFNYMYFTATQTGYYVPVLQPLNGTNIVVDNYTIYVY